MVGNHFTTQEKLIISFIVITHSLILPDPGPPFHKNKGSKGNPERNPAAWGGGGGGGERGWREGGGGKLQTQVVLLFISYFGTLPIWLKYSTFPGLLWSCTGFTSLINHMHAYYLCFHNPCKSADLLVHLSCCFLLFADKNRKPSFCLEFFFQGSSMKIWSPIIQ